MPSVAEWDRNSNGLGGRSIWYSAERCTNRTDPSPISSNQGHMRVVSGNLGYNQRTYDAKGTDRTDNCPDGADPIESFGDPKLSRPEFTPGSLVIFLAEDFSDSGLEPRPFSRSLSFAGCWLC